MEEKMESNIEIKKKLSKLKEVCSKYTENVLNYCKSKDPNQSNNLNLSS